MLCCLFFFLLSFICVHGGMKGGVSSKNDNKMSIGDCIFIFTSKIVSHTGLIVV
ncbi:hypothetical protein HanIR_Chr09g0397701 [Helianthus annuus]|nr:hypothetical protein HanIR_Chr09g0397701 [Helianthus annuus]